MSALAHYFIYICKENLQQFVVQIFILGLYPKPFRPRLRVSVYGRIPKPSYQPYFTKKSYSSEELCFATWQLKLKKRRQ